MLIKSHKGFHDNFKNPHNTLIRSYSLSRREESTKNKLFARLYVGTSMIGAVIRL